MFGEKHRRFGKVSAAAVATFAQVAVMSFVPIAGAGAASLTNVTIGESIVSVQTAALKAALQYGYFKQEGLNVSLPVIVGGSPVLIAGTPERKFELHQHRLHRRDACRRGGRERHLDRRD